jgi:trimeric autotransporter adhesin
MQLRRMPFCPSFSVRSTCLLFVAALSCAVCLNAFQTPGILSVTFSPTTITGGSGETATGTVTLNAQAPAGGVVVSLASSNVELAATMPTVTVPVGAASATFIVAANARYRPYSGLSFNATISATVTGSTRSATLNVTAQAAPPDFSSGSQAGANTQWSGLMCGGIAPIGGNTEILYSCSPAQGTGFGTCTFRQECLLGCRRVPPNGGVFNDFCATSGPNPIEVSRNYFNSGDHVPATIRTEAPVTIPTSGVPRVVNTDGNARSFSPDDVGGIPFPTGTGATSAAFNVATSYVPSIQFIDVGGFWFDDAIPPLLITSGRGGHAWAVMIPPNPPPAKPIPTPVQFKIVGLNPVTGGQSSLGQVHISGIPHGIGPTITFTSSHPEIVPAPPSVTPAASNLFGFDVNIATQPPSADTDVTITASDGRYSFSAVLTVRKPPPAPVLSGISVSPGSVVGGNSAIGAVTLSAPQSSPTVVQVSIIDTAPATLPSNNPPCPSSSRCHNVTVPAGATSANFTINTSPVTSQFNLNIFAHLPGSPGQGTLLLITAGGPTTVNALNISPVSLVGSASSTGTVTLTGAAASGGAVVTLSKALSNGGAGTVPVAMPASVTVPAGQTSASFTIDSSSVTATTNVRVSAAFNGTTVNADMTLYPLLAQVMFSGNVPGGTPATGTVMLNGPAPGGGAIVTLSSANTLLVTVPGTVTVPASQTSATFTANTAPVTQTTPVNISASLAGTTVSTPLFLVVSRAVSSVTLNPSTVVGPASSTATVTLRSAAPSGNAVVSLATSNSVLATVPFSVVVPSGQTSTTFTVNAAQVTTASTVVISATYENVTQSATLTINPSGSSTPAAPTLLSPPNQATGLTQPVTLDWNDVPNAASYEVHVDTSSTIAAPFAANPTVTTSHVTLSGLPAQQLWWRVRARNSAGVFGPFSSTRRFTPQSAAATASLSVVSINPSSVAGGTGSTGRVTLTSAAPAGGAIVSLTSSNTAVATVPANVTVASGATSATFTVATVAVGVSTPVTISAVYNGVTRTTTLTVSPPGQSATLAVTATGRSGERVTSTPTGINVLVGSTGSASFIIGTSIILRVTNDRDAIWSGACSSGGNKTKTCTFTLNGNAAITANVQ